MPAFQYGGQAVIEGVMMRGPHSRSVAVRRPDNSIVVDRKTVGSVTSRIPFLKWPFIRGVVVLIESLVMGIEALSFSAEQASGEAEEEKLGKGEIAMTILVALGLAVLLFVVLPTAATHYAARMVHDNLLKNLIEGVIRLAVFLIYVAGVGRMKDIQRVFMYHGAEHKVINAYEAGKPLEVAEVQRFSTFHPRCGTSFLLIVMVISILVFSLAGRAGLLWQIGSRVLLLPVVAGISYELLKLSGKHYDRAICRILITPGMWLQKLTTRPPDDSQVEVAIKALGAVLKEGEPVVR